MNASITSSMASRCGQPTRSMMWMSPRRAPNWESVLAAIDADGEGDAELVTDGGTPGAGRARRALTAGAAGRGDGVVAVAAAVIGVDRLAADLITARTWSPTG